MPNYKTIKVDLGPESSFTKLPASVDVGDWSYFLAKSKKAHTSCSRQCVRTRWARWWTGAALSCAADHGWRFEKTEGICINGPNSRMTAFPVAVEGGRLIATVPDD